MRRGYGPKDPLVMGTEALNSKNHPAMVRSRNNLARLFGRYSQ